MKLQDLFQKIYYYGYESLDTGKEVSLFQYYDDSISLTNIRYNLFCNSHLKQDILNQIEIDCVNFHDMEHYLLDLQKLNKFVSNIDLSSYEIPINIPKRIFPSCISDSIIGVQPKSNNISHFTFRPKLVLSA